MMDNYLSQPLLPLIGSNPALSKTLDSSVSKVRKYLKRYARQISQDVDHITILDICDASGELCPELLASIDGRPRKVGTTDRDHEIYSGQIKSRIRKIVNATVSIHSGQNTVADESVKLLAAVPNFLKPVVVHLPRKCSHRASPSKREAAPLTAYGILLLKVLLSVTSKHKITTLQALFIDHLHDLKVESYAVCHPSQSHGVRQKVYEVIRKLGFQRERRPSALSQEEIPQRLREQIEVYKLKAPSGAAMDPELRRLAHGRGVELVPMEEGTINLHCVSLATMLARIPRNDEMEIADLIRMEAKTVIEDDEPVTQYFNPLIDNFREQERDQTTPSKTKGYDSSMFDNAIGAVRAVAAYNGILKYHKRFNKAYNPVLDIPTRDAKKAHKKQTFPMSWLDFNLALLKERFDAITKSRSFKTDVTALRLCMCYVYLMMLRYTGVRQQGVRTCRIGWNIIFNKNGSITFHWRPHEIKNDKDFTKTVKPQHMDTFAPLVAALRKYYRLIYPHLVQLAKQSGTDLDGQFFPQVMCDGSVRPFGTGQQGALRFSDGFKWLTLKFLDFTDVEPAMRGFFNAHHIRGIAGDWIHNKIGVGIEGTAKFLGDHRQTVEQQYLDKSKIDSTLTLDEANMRAALIRSRTASSHGTVITDDFGADLGDPQIAALLNEKSELNAKLSEIDELLTSLMTSKATAKGIRSAR